MHRFTTGAPTRALAHIAVALVAMWACAPAGAQQSAKRAQAPQAHVVGGLPASPRTFGMLAYVINAQPDAIYLCSGTVLASNLVLTAGHCGENTSTGVHYPASAFRVITGDVDWSGAAGQASNVSRVIVDPSFKRTTLTDDATLLVLSTPTTAPAVRLASSPADAALVAAGTPGAIAGWGSTATSSLPDDLHWAPTVVQSPSLCAARAAQLGASFNPTSQMCVLDAPLALDGPCRGDSGGPLLAAGGAVEVGIISFGEPGCSTAQPGFLTRADAIAAWAQGWMAAERPPTVSPPAPSPPATSPPAASPTTASSPAASPAAVGTYRGSTRQCLAFIARTSHRRRIVAVRFSLRLRCTRRRPLVRRIAPLPGRRRRSWPLRRRAGHGNALTFTRTVTAAGERYRLTGVFAAGGRVSGTVTSTWRNRRFGTCRSGRVTWHARATRGRART